jgi:hypothetical protein
MTAEATSAVEVPPTVDLDAIDKLPYRERCKLLLHLLDRQIVEPTPLGDGNDFLCLRSNEDVRPDVTASTCVVPSWEAFTPKRLIILEPSIEIVNATETSQKKTPVEVPFKRWRGTKKGYQIETVVRIDYERTFITPPRSVWSVLGVYIGNRRLWPNHGEVNGSAFGPSDHEFDLRVGEIPRGIPFTASIRHNTKHTIPFRALLIGKARSVHEQETP